MKLFRGDNIFIKNDPKLGVKNYLYYEIGLCTKAFGGGSYPDNIERFSLNKAIISHIHQMDIIDEKYYSVTDFLSFSKAHHRAKYYCASNGKIKLNDCLEYEETRFIITLNIDDNKLEEIGSGIYKYKYKCNRELITSGKKQDSNDLNAYLIDIARNKPCDICGIGSEHEMILIDSYKFIDSNFKADEFETAKNFSLLDKEWLILPFDPLRDNPAFRRTCIPRADFWSVKHFLGEGELRPLF
ncbi:hypothetical protein JYG30_17045 [Fibrella sp. USSR17]